MSKEKDTQQMSLLGDSPANPSVSQEKEKEQMTIDTSGMKLLELSENVNLDGSLGKMLKVLLTSKTAWSSDRCVMTWKKKVSKSNVLLFQLQASVRGIKGKEFGLLHTPTATEIGMRSPEAMEKRKKYRESIGRKTVPPGNLLEQIHMMYPTPTASDIEGGAAKDVQMKDGRFFRENKKGERWGVKLRDAMEMMPTPTARDHKDMGYQPTWKPSRDKSVPRTVLKDNKPGGKLNPHFVEMLMAYPMNWTKIEPTELKVSETQSFPSSQENLDSPSSKQKRMYRTPTAMDIAEDSFIFAAKLLKGKINRSSNSRVQITLSTDVAMEYLKSNPHLIDEYDKPFKIRPNLPNKFEFISYLKSNSTIKDLANKTDLPKTKIEHWFRKDKCFSYPSIEDWNKIKPYLKTIQFDDELTYEIDGDWKS